MRSRTITEDEILAVSTRDESHFFDRKALGISGKKAQKIAVVFANADGGEFLVGISDDKEENDPSKRWHGTPKLEELNGLLQALFQVTPTLELKYEVLNSPSRQGQVLRVIVEKSAEVHKTSDGTVYQRYGAQSLLTFPRFHRHLYKEEQDEIGGQYEHQDQTAVYGRV